MTTLTYPLDVIESEILFNHGAKEFAVLDPANPFEGATLEQLSPLAGDHEIEGVKYHFDHYTTPEGRELVKVYKIKDWIASAPKRAELKELSDIIQAEYAKTSALENNARKKLIEIFGERDGLNKYRMMMNGELPKVAEKLGLTHIVKKG